MKVAADGSGASGSGSGVRGCACSTGDSGGVSCSGGGASLRSRLENVAMGTSCSIVPKVSPRPPAALSGSLSADASPAEEVGI